MKIKKTYKALFLSAVMIATLCTTAASAATNNTSNGTVRTDGTIHTDAVIEDVLSQWDHVIIYSPYSEHNENQVYIQLHFINGYTYTETNKKVSTVAEELLGRYVWQYNRTYKTY